MKSSKSDFMGIVDTKCVNFTIYFIILFSELLLKIIMKAFKICTVNNTGISKANVDVDALAAVASIVVCHLNHEDLFSYYLQRKFNIHFMSN